MKSPVITAAARLERGCTVAIRSLLIAFVLALLAIALPARSQTVPAPELIEVTATRTPEPVATVPASVTVISGEELRTRDVHDLATALSLLPGVEAPAGGDAGPASAVPSFLGLREFDAFLLVVDGVPWGGAFNPSIPTLDFADVERIEVLKGSAPVTYGATSFVGVIQVIHYPAGRADSEVRLAYGAHGQSRGTLSAVLPSLGHYVQSVSLDGESQGFSDRREQIADGKLLYRGAGELAGGQLRLDLDMTYVRTTPPSPVVRVGGALTTLTPLDANYNPADARIDENRYHAVLGYGHATPLGAWDTTVSYAFSEISDIRGFLRPDLIGDGSQNADSQAQRRRIGDLYADSHLSADIGAINVLYGADLLYGLGKQASINGAYAAPLVADPVLPPTTALHVDEINSIADRRLFLGQYVQADYKPGPRLDLTAGIRLNETFERLRSVHVDGFDATLDSAATSARRVVRPSGTAGASYAVWQRGRDGAVLYADYRNTFKPAATDFGPDLTSNVLSPETAQAYEVGIKGSVAHGRLDYDAEAFRVDFSNLVVSTTDAAGNPILQNAGGERLRGVEAGLRAHLRPDLTLAFNGSYHDARFTRYVATEGGAEVDAGGHQLPLSPHWLASAGVLYEPASGQHASLVASYVGRRFLDLANTAPAGSYVTFDATAGYRFGRYDLLFSGTNISDQRPPVTESEFGDSSYYLLQGRTLLFALRAKM